MRFRKKQQLSSDVRTTVPDAKPGETADEEWVPAEPVSPSWAAVFSLAMGVFGLLTAEYLPTSLLTPMAADLGVSEAVAGQAVTVTAAAAMMSGLLTASLTRRIDRRIVLLGFTVLLIISNVLVAVATNMAVLMLMRILLGVALGGFWSMAAAVAMRLVPAALVPRAVSVIFSGIAVATIVAVPLGSYLGDLVELAQHLPGGDRTRGRDVAVPAVHAAPDGAPWHGTAGNAVGGAAPPGLRGGHRRNAAGAHWALRAVHLYPARAGKRGEGRRRCVGAAALRLRSGEPRGHTGVRMASGDQPAPDVDADMRR